jgi:hypothetical protein
LQGEVWCRDSFTEEAVLKELAAAYGAFSQLKEYLSKGAKFYNDLTQVI